MSSDVIFDLVSADDLEEAIKIEQQGYPPDEAGSLDAFRLRQSQAGNLFLGAYDTSRRIIGYVCGTLSADTTLTHKSMSTHVPDGGSVCVHSVCVDPTYRRCGIGLALLKEYIKRLEGSRYEWVLLITHEELRVFYEKAGFEWMGKSEVKHGAKEWFEMRRNLTSVVDDGVNKYDLTCPRPGCGSVIVKKGIATWVERASVEMEPREEPRHALLPALPEPPESMAWWLVTPSPMTFENIGFTRTVSITTGSEPMKLLVCAECELGPLGWSVVGGSEFWLACSRVAYVM